MRTSLKTVTKKLAYVLITKRIPQAGFTFLSHSLPTYANFLESSSRTSSPSQPLQVISNFLEPKSSASRSMSAPSPQAVPGNKPSGTTRNQSTGNPGNAGERAPQVPQVSVEAFSGLRLRSVAVTSLCNPSSVPLDVSSSCHKMVLPEAVVYSKSTEEP